MKKLTSTLQIAYKNTFVQGGVLLTAANFLTGFMNYLFNVIVGRALGPEGFSEIVALFSYVAIFSIPIGVITTFLIQKIGSAQNTREYSVSIYSWMLEKIGRWKYLTVILLIITPFLPWLTNLSPFAAYALPFLVIVSLISAFYTGTLQGLHLFAIYTFITIITTLIKLTGAGFAYFELGGVQTVILFIIIAHLTSLILSDFIFRKKVKKTVTNTRKIMRRIIHIFQDKQLWFTIGSTGALALLVNFDIVYVKRMFPADEAGIYSAWTIYAKILYYLIGPLLTLSLIFFSSKKHQIYHQIFFIGSFILFVVAGFTMMLLYGTYERTLVELIFGEKYLSVIPFLEWAAFFGTGFVMMTFMNYYYLARKSKLSLLPMVLFPLYLIALFIYADEIVKVMYVNTTYAFTIVALYLLVFFKDRFLFLFDFKEE